MFWRRSRHGVRKVWFFFGQPTLLFVSGMDSEKVPQKKSTRTLVIVWKTDYLWNNRDPYSTADDGTRSSSDTLKHWTTLQKAVLLNQVQKHSSKCLSFFLAISTLFFSFDYFQLFSYVIALLNIKEAEQEVKVGMVQLSIFQLLMKEKTKRDHQNKFTCRKKAFFEKKSLIEATFMDLFTLPNNI